MYLNKSKYLTENVYEIPVDISSEVIMWAFSCSNELLLKLKNIF